MTEEEMKRTWCPHVRAMAGTVREDGSSRHSGVQHSYNRVIDMQSGSWAFPEAAGCIGSVCSQWRWVQGFPTGPDDPLRERYHGYCGLAGKP